MAKLSLYNRSGAGRKSVLVPSPMILIESEPDWSLGLLATNTVQPLGYENSFRPALPHYSFLTLIFFKSSLFLLM